MGLTTRCCEISPNLPVFHVVVDAPVTAAAMDVAAAILAAFPFRTIIAARMHYS